MADLHVSRTGDPSRRVSRTPADREGRRGRREQERPPRRERPGAEELAEALSEYGRGELRARYTQDGAGEALVLVIDVSRGETVAVITPEELRELAERTGLPAGLLFQGSS